MSDSDFEHDDDLRALLRGGDPASSLSPADPAALAILLEDIMSADLDIRPAPPEQPVPGRRTRATWLVAAAAVAAIAAVGGFAISGLGGGGDADPPVAGPKPSAAVSDANAGVEGLTTELGVAATQGKCAPPTPAILAQYPQAFEGTVTAIDGDTVTIATTEVLNGEVGETVTVTAPPELAGAMLGAVQFEVGGDYLVAAFNGQLSMCYSGVATGDLKSPFQKAFVH